MRIPGNPAGRELLRRWNGGEIQKSPFSPFFFFSPPIFSPSLGSPGAGKRDFPVVDPNKLVLGENIGKMVLGRGCCGIRRGMGIAFPKFPFFGGWRWSWFPPRGKFPSFPWFWGCFPRIWLRLRSHLAAVPLFPGIPGKFLLSIARGRERAWNPAEFRPFSGGIPAFLQEKPQEAAPGSIPSRRIPLNLDFWDCAPPLSRITATPGAN